MKQCFIKVTFFFYFFSLLEAKLKLNGRKEISPHFLFPFEKLFKTLFFSKTRCVWTNEFVSEQEINILRYSIQFQQSTIINLDYNSVNVSANYCYDNVVLNSDFLNKNPFFNDRIPTVKHIFVIIDMAGNDSEINNTDAEAFKIFGLAKTVLLQQSGLFKLSSPYFPPRTLQYKKSLSMLKDVHVTNLNGRNVNVATFNCSLFSILKEPINSGTHDGIEMRMMNEMAYRLNFTWRFVDLAGKWGKTLPNGTWVGGIIGALDSGNAEFGFCNLWNVLLYDKYIEFGPQWNVVYYTYMVPRPYMVRGFWIIIVQLFEKSVWVMLTGTFLLVCFLFWKFMLTMSMDTLSGAVESILTVFGVLIATTSYIPPSVKFARQVIVCWSIFSFFISALFCNTIITRLMIPHISSLVDSVKDIVTGDLLWACPGYLNNSMRNVYFNLEDPWQRKMEGRFQNLTRNTSRAASHTGRFVFPVQKLGFDYVFVDVDGLELSDLSGFRVMKQSVNEFFVSFAFSKHSPLLGMSHTILQRFFEVGLVDYWKKDVILHNGIPQVKFLLHSIHTESVDTFKPLTFSNNLVAFRILLSGWALASVIIACELFIHYIKHCSLKVNSESEVLRFPTCIKPHRDFPC